MEIAEYRTKSMLKFSLSDMASSPKTGEGELSALF
jgi:hypothetical protein